MNRTLCVLLGVFIGANVASAETVIVRDAAMPENDCDVSTSIDVSFSGNEGTKTLWESYRHTRDTPLYVAVKGSEITIFPNQATLSCIDEASWNRASEVVPNDGTSVVTYAASCDISVPSKPHTFQVAFTPRYGEVTQSGTADHEKMFNTFSGDEFVENTVTYPNYYIRNYQTLYTSCLTVTIR